MKFKINKDHFLNGLQQVLNIVGTKSTMPILNNVLIEGDKDTIRLTTTNLDIGVTCRVKADISEAGGITLPVKKLHDIVRELPSIEIELEVFSNNQVKIASGSSLYRIMGIEKDQFPPTAKFDDKNHYLLPQSDLLKMLKCVSYAQSTDESRQLMNGVYFNFEEGKLTLAATDGRRLALISKEIDVTEDNVGSLILPARTVLELERLLDQGDKVKISYNERQVAFDIYTSTESDETGILDSVHLLSKVVEGKYPNYRQVIPQETDRYIKVNREILLNSVRRSALVATDKNISVTFKMADNSIEISGSSAEIGESQEKLAVEYSGSEVRVAFNPFFFMDTLKVLTRDEIIFEFKDEMSPGVIRTPDSFLCVVMPLRLN